MSKVWNGWNDQNHLKKELEITVYLKKSAALFAWSCEIQKFITVKDRLEKISTD